MRKRINNLTSEIIRFPILWLLLGAFLLRVFLSPFGTLELDFFSFVGWSERLVNLGFSRFYEEWSDYLPGYLYVLWFLGKIEGLVPIPEVLLYKLPAILADVATGFLIYKATYTIVKKQKLALVASAVYLLNPAVFANSTLWGQVDGITAFFALASLFFATSRPALGAIALGIGALTKVQAGFVAPIVALLWVKKLGMSRAIGFSLLSLIIFLLGFIPFSVGKPFPPFIFERLGVTANQYPYTSVNAFSFWAIGGGWWRSDVTGLVTPQLVGILVFVAFVLVAIFVLLKRREQEAFLGAALLFAASFLFLTRMHERHLLAVLAPLSVAAVANSILFLPYVIFSLTYLANLYFSFIWITQDFKMVFSQGFINLLILANLSALGILLFSWSSKKFIKLKTIIGIKALSGFQIAKAAERLAEISFVQKNAKLILALIILFALATRVFSLWHPTTFYFDEVYHAFTAREMLRGNPAAWEWWNTPPEGFAYEWTHPPLAKLGMVAGMLVLGENPIGWRLPGALLGVGSIFLVYLIALSLFKNQTVALLSSAIFALDGLPLVMSRIGMNDAYFLFFALATIYFFLKEKIFLTALALGLAISSKWTAVWIIPVLVVGFFLFKRKLNLEYLSFLLVPPVLYLVSYMPFFTSGHNIFQFIELQKQMWWYHTGLSATHPYQSSWWSWPVLARPIWLFTESKNELVSNIYAMGNPVVFWAGLLAILVAWIRGVLERNNKLLFLIVAYIGFFVPWAISPRIMFLYHYLPSLPFLALALGWILGKQDKIVITLFYLLLFALYLFFFPHWTGIFVPKWLDTLYYWLPGWK